MKKFLQVLFFIIVIFNVLSFLIGLLDSGGSSQDYRYVENACDEYMREDEFTADRLHQREWKLANRSQSFCMSYQSSEATSADEEEKRAGLMYRVEDYENFWGEVYVELVDQSRGVLDFMSDSLLQVAGEELLTERQLASIVVSFVQDIPYSYVLAEDCSERETGNKPCLGNIPLGIVSPCEFAHHLMGDCDTRAVLLYVLLEKMGFDPMIVVSDEYAHAMLALNIPAQGDYIKYAGKKYYFWETTAIGWDIGMLPPDSNNKAYWKKALVKETNVL